jgi:hypothetical protein
LELTRFRGHPTLSQEVNSMPETRAPYAPEFRRQMVDLVRTGRDPDDLPAEFEPTAQSICNWVAAAGITQVAREEKSSAPRTPRNWCGARHPLKSGGLVRARDRHSAVRVFGFMSAHQAIFPITEMGRVLGVSTAGYYAWLKRVPWAHAEADATLLQRIQNMRRRVDR